MKFFFRFSCCVFFFLSVFAFSFCSQKKHSGPASFYFWRTTFNLSPKEKEGLAHFNTKELYVRFFDVDKAEDSVVFLGEIQGLEKMPDSIAVVPVVFITNRTFLNYPAEKIKDLAKTVFEKICKIDLVPHSKTQGTAFSKLQFDCDWSGKTKENYFLFLSEIKKLAGTSHPLSCTIRLHQAKYPVITGVPPVDEGVLMFYNMGNVKNEQSENSIYNKKDAEKYVNFIGNYPLKLSVALPLFSWMAQYRNGKLINLLSKTNGIDSVNKSKINETEAGKRYKVISSFLQNGNYFMEGDELKVEKLSAEELAEAAHLIADNMKGKDCNIIFYDLDEYNLKLFSDEDLEKILAPFN